jgi:UDP-N-acetyl-D-mannosaminuronic acid transferase (WecB/TagA/CpsF family)
LVLTPNILELLERVRQPRFLLHFGGEKYFVSAHSTSCLDERNYRRILGVRFFVGNAFEAVELGTRPGLVVVPAGPALMELPHDREYRQALLEADLAITDSGFMVLLWNVMAQDCIRRVSGLEYLKILLPRTEFREPGAALWVMPSQDSLQRNLGWLKSQGFPTAPEDCYVAPKYAGSTIVDDVLVDLVNARKPRHVIIGLGGGVQEKLGLYLRGHCVVRPSIHCIGAALGFLTGDQIRIPDWADRWILGWLFRCASNPKRFVPRYAKALRLPLLLWRYQDQMPELLVDS